MSSEKFCLRWNDFESNISSAFRELREDKDFFDVTLACDEEQIQAHKVILSACSPFFRTVLRRNRHEHPLLYLKGVKYTDLVSVLNFIYHGEVNVAQEELNSFLAVAEDLKVKGLTQNSSGGGGSSTKTTPSRATAPSQQHHTAPPPPKRPRPTPVPVAASSPISRPQTSSYQVEDDDIQEVQPIVKAEPIQQPAEQVVEHSGAMEQYGEEYGEYEGYEAEDYDAGAMVDPNMSGTDGNKEFNLALEAMIEKCEDELASVYTCLNCGKRMANKTKIKRHVEVHLEISRPCTICFKNFKTRNALSQHYSVVHGQTVSHNSL